MSSENCSKIKFQLNEIQCFKDNIQEALNILQSNKDLSKSRYRSICTFIKTNCRYIKETKELIPDGLKSPDKCTLPLFHVEVPVPEVDIRTLDSFFGTI